MIDLAGVILDELKRSAGFQEVAVTLLDKLKSLWLKVVTLESSDKAVKLLNNVKSIDLKALLLGAADEVCFSNVDGGNF